MLSPTDTHHRTSESASVSRFSSDLNTVATPQGIPFHSQPNAQQNKIIELVVESRRVKRAPQDNSVKLWTKNEIDNLTQAEFDQLMKTGSPRLNRSFFECFYSYAILSASEKSQWISPTLMSQVPSGIFERFSMAFAAWMIHTYPGIPQSLQPLQAQALICSQKNNSHFFAVVFSAVNNSARDAIIYQFPDQFYAAIETLSHNPTGNAITGQLLKNLLSRFQNSSSFPPYLLGWMGTNVSKLHPFIFSDAESAVNIINKLTDIQIALLTSQQIKGMNFKYFNAAHFKHFTDQQLAYIDPKPFAEHGVDAQKENRNKSIFQLAFLKKLRPETAGAIFGMLNPDEMSVPGTPLREYLVYLSQQPLPSPLEWLKGLPDTHLGKLPGWVFASILMSSDAAGKSHNMPVPERFNDIPDWFFLQMTVQPGEIPPDVSNHLLDVQFLKKLSLNTSAALCAKLLQPDTLFTNPNVVAYLQTRDIIEKINWFSALPTSYITKIPDNEIRAIFVAVQQWGNFNRIPIQLAYIFTAAHYQQLPDTILQNLFWGPLIEQLPLDVLRKGIAAEPRLRNFISQYFVKQKSQLTDPASIAQTDRLIGKFIVAVPPENLMDVVRQMPDFRNYSAVLRELDTTFFERLENSALSDTQVIELINILFTETTIANLSSKVISRLEGRFTRIWKALAVFCIYHLEPDQVKTVPDSALLFLLKLGALNKNYSSIDKLLSNLTASQRDALLRAPEDDLARLGNNIAYLNSSTQSTSIPTINPQIPRSKRVTSPSAIVFVADNPFDLSITTDNDDPTQASRTGNGIVNLILEATSRGGPVLDEFYTITKTPQGQPWFAKLQSNIVTQMQVYGKKIQQQREIMDRNQFIPTAEAKAIIQHAYNEINNTIQQARQFWEANVHLDASWKSLVSPADFPSTFFIKQITLIGHGGPGVMGNFNYTDFSEHLSTFAQNLPQLELIDLVFCETNSQTLPNKIYEVFARNGRPMPKQIEGYVTSVAVYADNVNSYWNKIGLAQYDTDRSVLFGHRGITNPLKWVSSRNQSGMVITSEQFTYGNVKVFDTSLGRVVIQRAVHLAEKLALKTQAQEQVDAYRTSRKLVINHLKKTFTLKEPILVSVWQNEGGSYMARYVDAMNPNVLNDTSLPQTIALDFLEKERSIRPGLEYVRARSEFGSKGEVKLKNSVEMGGESVNSLNAGFLALSLFGLKDINSLSNDEKFHLYIGIASSAVPVLGDAVAIAKIVSQLSSPMGIVARSVEIWGQVAQVANALTLAATTGWNIYELATTNDPIKRLGLELSLPFNGAALVSGGLGIIGTFMTSSGSASLASAGAGLTAGGYFAAPLAALGFGFSSLGIQLKQQTALAHELDTFLANVNEAAEAGPVSSSNGFLSISPYAVNSELNFKTKKATFIGLPMQKSKSNGWSVPEHIRNNGSPEYFDLWKELGGAEQVDLNTDDYWVSMPTSPRRRIAYGFSNTAGVSLDTRERKAVDKLKNVFCYANSTNNLNAAFNRNQNVTQEPLKHRTVLDKHSKGLVFQRNVDESINYEVVSGGGQYCFVGLNPSIKLQIEEDPTEGPSVCTLEFPEAKLTGDNDVHIENGILKISDQGQLLWSTDISKLKSTRIIIKGATVWNMDLTNQKCQLQAVDIRRAPNLSVKIFLDKLANKGLTEDTVTLILGDSIPSKMDANEQENYDRSAIHVGYDTKTRQFITPSKSFPTPGTASPDDLLPWRGYKLVKRINSYAFFVDTQTQTLIKTDCQTNEPLISFKLPLSPYALPMEKNYMKNFVTSVEEVGGQIVLHQELPLPGQKRDTAKLTYTLAAGEMQLEGVIGLNKDASKRLLDELKKACISPQSFSLTQVLAKALGIPALSAEIRMAKWLTVRIVDANGTPQNILINSQNGTLLSIDEDYALVKSGQLGDSQERGSWILLYSPTKQLLRRVTISQENSDGRNQIPEVSLPLREEKRFYLSREENGEIRFLDGKEIYTLDGDGNLKSIAEVRPILAKKLSDDNPKKIDKTIGLLGLLDPRFHRHSLHNNQNQPGQISRAMLA